ncbi:MAG: purine-nucleoside phosphorylase [Candidatus Cloacimonadia bacterium]
MKKVRELLPDTINFLRDESSFTPEIGIILGTGLSEIADEIEIESIIPYSDIPHFPISTAPSHKGRLVMGSWQGKNSAVLQGRVHCYEGYSPFEVSYPIFVLHELGVKNIIITNAAGSLNENLQPGDIVLITDHINLTGGSPLVGINDDSMGPRFPSMNNAYDKNLRRITMECAQETGITPKEGVYAGLLGPSMETFAECKMLQIVGADLVGLSTINEVIVARYLDMAVLGISVVTNFSNLFHDQIHNQDEIERIAKASQAKLKLLLQHLIPKIKV